jgi:uncharacterized protein involved in exopolysaccharide biosynthesis
LSFGSETGRTRSGTKGFSNKTKKLKRKKQEYHTHRRIRFQEAEQIDPEQARARTKLALDRLGHQVISAEPGGYNLEAWTRNVESLLDDFEEKVGEERITAEFHERSREAIRQLARPSSHAIDSEIEALRRQESAAKEEVAELTKRMTAKVASLREEREACERDLKAEREKLSALREAKQRNSFMSRFRRAGPSTLPVEERVAALEAKLKEIDDRIDEHTKKKKRSIRVDHDHDNKEEDGVKSSESGGAPALGEGTSLDDIQSRLDAIYARLGELQALRQRMIQLADEREVATKKISDMISSLDLGQLPESASTLG